MLYLKKRYTYRLTLEEVEQAAARGLKEAAAYYERNKDVKFIEPYPGELWTHYIEQELADVAFAKFKDSEFPNYSGLRIVSRWTEHTYSKPAKGLKVKAKQDGVCVCVIGRSPNYELLGWIECEYAKRPRLYCADWPMHYLVPMDDLKPMDELKQYLTNG